MNSDISTQYLEYFQFDTPIGYSYFDEEVVEHLAEIKSRVRTLLSLIFVGSEYKDEKICSSHLIFQLQGD